VFCNVILVELENRMLVKAISANYPCYDAGNYIFSTDSVVRHNPGAMVTLVIALYVE
jgi:hypothetical protein